MVVKRWGDKIVGIGEKFPEKIANTIYKKYLEIVEITDNVKINVLNKLGTDFSEASLVSIRENLLKKAKDLMVSFSDFSVGESVEQNKKLLEKLENIKAEVFLFASTFKVLSSQEKLQLTDLEGSHIEIKDSLELTEEEKESMIRIFEENRVVYTPELLKVTLQEFKQALNTSPHEFQILRFNNEIIAFIRFDNLPNGNLYAGSLNVRTEVRGSAIGSAMLNATLYKKAEEYNIEAVVYEKNPMLDRYINDFGFELGEKIENYNNTKETFYKLYMPQTEEKTMFAKAA